MYKIAHINISKWKIILISGDLCCYIIAVFGSLYLNPKIEFGILAFLSSYKYSFLLMFLIFFTVFYIADIFDYQQDYRQWNNIRRIIASVMVGSLLAIVLFYFPFGAFIGRTLLVIQAGTLALLLVLWRWTFSTLALPKRLKKRLIIVGAGEAGCAILNAILRRPNCGFEVLGFIDDDPKKKGTDVEGLPVLGNSSQLQDIVEQNRLTLLIIAITREKSDALLRALSRLSWNGCQLIDMLSLYEIIAEKIPIDHISDVWLYLNSLQAGHLYYRHLKRLFDFGLALLLFAFTCPLFLLTALVIKFDSSGPIFFRQKRLGQNGRPFEIIKFRTMINNAESDGPRFAILNDRRITRVGWILRKIRFDELPQLINVLKGEMSFVGPRPEREEFVREFQELKPLRRPGRRIGDPPGWAVQVGFKETIPFYSYRLVVKPGITGWAQVKYPYASSLEQTKEKLKYDLYYIKNMGVFLDLSILLKTVRIVLFGRGT